MIEQHRNKYIQTVNKISPSDDQSTIENIIGRCTDLPIMHKTNGRWTQQRNIEAIDYGYNIATSNDEDN